ncbi:hypothetical protein CkaCkLH20_00001 [Colletotrichum karsti]|uniref:NAD(P)-binding domain-containing protein n=1 Tax=Colletotrichum karsti TaxID=1095194 RepID=A0A9P6IJV0_9PEZI|nr:uncharacterized protein CkaCkLH20_00001 [Colletotrichum karsti]KAF9881965.1 hypothetical protein CkaCkLH20_00001 [Colletotrichum karsti]
MSADELLNVAFFGATGGTVFSCLVHALKKEYIHCHVLVRDTGKLHRLLTGATGTSSHDLLRVIQGDIRSRSAVKSTIFPPCEILTGPVDVIIFGVGGVDVHGRMIYDSDVSKDGISTVFQALISEPSECPRIVAIGSLGIGGQVTRLLTRTPSAEAASARASYAWFKGSSAYDDKSELEEVVLDEMQEAGLECFDNLVVQPGLLTDNRPLGLAAIRHGSPGNPPPGYFISREDLGEWLFYHGILGAMEGAVVVCGP